MKKWLRSDKGFSLIEMLIVLGIMSTVGGAMVMTTTTITRIAPQNTNEVIALYQAQNAGYWITRDVQTAQTVDTAPITGELLKLTLTVVGSDDAIITYQLQNTPDGLKKLVRTCDSVSMLVAEYIYYDPIGNPDTSTKILPPDALYPDKVTFRITTKSNEATVIRKYEATQRVPTT
jgi:prepilin-type N-terminal cleavage/methylation domain-containing protein